MPRSGWTRRAAWSGLLACAVVGFGACGGGTSNSRDPVPTSPQVVRLTGQPQHVVLPAHRKYGIYVDDADNSGYSLSCTAIEAGGRQVHLDDRTPATITSSDTDNLDLVYDTGSGDLTFTCSASGARTTTRPLTGILR